MASFIEDNEKSENRVHADCSSKDPKWASINNGGLICTSCSGVHRLLGVEFSFIQSLVMDTLLQKDIDFLKTVGNQKMNAVLEYSVTGLKKPVEHTSRENREAYIRAKYVEKRFSLREGVKKSDPEFDTPISTLSEKEKVSAGLIEYQGFVIIKVIAARHLKIGDMFTSDPYVVAICGAQHLKTKVVFNTLNPDFNETLMLCVSGTDPINFQVWDYDKFKKHDLLGDVHFSVPELQMIIANGEKVLDMTLDLKPKGTLHIQLSFQAIDH